MSNIGKEFGGSNNGPIVEAIVGSKPLRYTDNDPYKENGEYVFWEPISEIKGMEIKRWLTPAAENDSVHKVLEMILLDRLRAWGPLDFVNAMKMIIDEVISTQMVVDDLKIPLEIEQALDRLWGPRECEEIRGQEACDFRDINNILDANGYSIADPHSGQKFGRHSESLSASAITLYYGSIQPKMGWHLGRIL